MNSTYNMPDIGLFGKRCRIKHVSNMKEGFVYRIVNSGIRSNCWKELPLGRAKSENVTHDYSEEIVIVVCDTLINENSELERVALKDIEIMQEGIKTVEDFEALNAINLDLASENEDLVERIGKLIGYIDFLRNTAQGKKKSLNLLEKVVKGQLGEIRTEEPFINKPCISSGVCEHDKNKVLDKIKAEIEQLRLHKAQFLTNDNKVCIDSQEVLNILDRYKAESEEP